MTLTPSSHVSSTIPEQSKSLHVHTTAESTTSDTTEATAESTKSDTTVATTTTSNLNTAAITSEHAESTTGIQFTDQNTDMKEPSKVANVHVAETCTPAGGEKEIHIGWDQFKDNIKILLIGVTGKFYIILEYKSGWIQDFRWGGGCTENKLSKF